MLVVDGRVPDDNHGMEPSPGFEATEAILGASAPMQHLRRELEVAARTASTVLLTGETGVGKGLVARAIHRRSGRSREPFVHVDCAGLAPGIVESELFGHERGAFTGAVERRVGRFELAAKGTLFLDEIGDLSLALQAKLLRVLQDREFERLGATRTQQMAARVIAATHRDLFRLAREGSFREDLLYRLFVLHVRVPPLRERITDIPALVERGLRDLARTLGANRPRVEDSFLHRLMDHDWPGNVRELMNLVERLLARGAHPVWDASVLEGALEIPRQSPGLGTERAPTRDRLEAALRDSGGNVSRAARVLGVARSTLRYRLRGQGLAASREGD
jgi:transcriptional regulator with GAF, ATPase, and Fis domain